MINQENIVEIIPNRIRPCTGAIRGPQDIYRSWPVGGQAW
jgi:hypothetical protein